MAMTALIVDDERLAREELKYLLDSVGGVEVIAQGQNGIEAVHLIRTHHPDVVFLDVQMPGLDGFAVLKKLLERDDADRMPQIIFATAFDQYAVRAFDVNAIDYLLKPFDRARLLKTLVKARLRIATPSAESPVTTCAWTTPKKPRSRSAAPRPSGSANSSTSSPHRTTTIPPPQCGCPIFA